MPVSAEKYEATLVALRPQVLEILEHGDDPTEVLSLGQLVRRSAPVGLDLDRLLDALELAEIVGTVAGAIANEAEGLT